MSTIVVTGSCGLIGSESIRFFCKKAHNIVGIDNDMRSVFFGPDASTRWNREKLIQEVPNYHHANIDIRNRESVDNLFSQYGEDIGLIIHAAAQPSHDWAASDPITDFTVNANGTLILLEATRRHCPDAVFIFTSTNKVYGDLPNVLPLVEMDTRWEIAKGHRYENGIDETMNVDQCKHSLFGVSKIAADIMVQEYGRYFNMKTVCFRGGCLTGPNHSGTQLHGFLAYLMKCAITGDHYTVFGYKAKQVRDNIHSYDLVNIFWHFCQNPRSGEVYNVGGSRHSNCSMLEAIASCEKITDKKMNWSYSDKNRIGDHIWYISDVSKFKDHYPNWEFEYDMDDILQQIYNGIKARL